MLRALALYFAFMLAAMTVLSLPLAQATLLAVKAAPHWAVALTGATAASLAAIFDWHFVRRAFRLNALARLRGHKLFSRVEGWVKVAPFFTVMVFAALPIPFTIVRVLVPLSGYPCARYVAAVWLGRFPRIFVIAFVGTAIEIPTNVLVALLAGSLTIAVILAIARKMGWIGVPKGP